MRAAAPDPIQVVLDLPPPGRVVSMGGCSVAPISPLPYLRLMPNSVVLPGQWMYPRPANQGLVEMIGSGVLDIGHESVTVCP